MIYSFLLSEQDNRHHSAELMPLRAIWRPILGSRVSGGALKFVTGGECVRTAAVGFRHDGITAVLFGPLFALSLSRNPTGN